MVVVQNKWRHIYTFPDRQKEGKETHYVDLLFGDGVMDHIVKK